MKPLFSIFIFVAGLLASISALAQESETFPLFKSSAKGYLTYRQFQAFENASATTPIWKKQIDVRKLELKGEYYLSREAEVEFELEFEHGGTGSTLEYDDLEEAGEFEAETEKGGEIVVSEFYYRRLFAPTFWYKVGKFPVYISLGSVQHSPLLHPSIEASSGEPNLLPGDWRETGVELEKRFGAYGVRAAVINGLNSEFFRKHRWIGGGYQRQFETINAENLAANLSLEYGDVRLDDGVAVAIYYGNTSGNRFKRNLLATDATVLLTSVFGNMHFGGLGVRGQIIRGTLENSDRVSTANTRLTGIASAGNFASLGHKANLEQIEFSYRHELADPMAVTGFVSYEHVDTMSEVQGAVIRDDRYNQLFTTAGLMFTWDTAMFAKAQYVRHSTGLETLPDTEAYELAFGFDLQGFNL